MGTKMSAMRDSIVRPAALFRRCAEVEESARAAADRRALLGVALLPLVVCFSLLGLLASRAAGGKALGLSLAFIAATWPAAAWVFWIVARLLGYRPGYVFLLGAWGASYWATDLFLAALAATHILAPALGIAPSEIPAWASIPSLVAYLCAALWKLLYALAMIRYAIGAKGFRFAIALAALLFLAGLLALASAWFLGFKVPII